MYHGIPIDYHLIIFVFAILAWVGRGIYKGFQQISKQIKGGSPNAAKVSPVQQAIADARQQGMAQQQAPAQRPGPIPTPRPAQTLPVRTPPLTRAREMPRRPDAGGPAVPREATDEQFRRQETALIASEPSALAMPLTDSSVSAGQPRALFGNTDDLVRAIILQEVLGPPLSRRSSQTPPSPQ